MGLGEEVNAVVIKSRLHIIHTTYHCWHWPWSLGWVVFVRFLHWKVTPFFLPPPSYTVLFRRKSLFRKSFLGGSPHLGNKSCPVSSRAEYPPKLFGNLLHRFAYSPNVMHFYQYFYAGSFYFLQIQEPYRCFWKPRNIFGEGNGTPLQYSCLENSVDGGAW